MTSIVLLGPDGQVGWELRRALAPLGELLALPRQAQHPVHGTLCGDLARPEAVADTLTRLKPRIVVNAAAYTAVDRAEAEPVAAHTVNAEAPAALAQVMRALDGWLVHYSTDYVFDGSGQKPRDEDAVTGPLSTYGRTKLAGEAAIRASGCRHLILRTSWVHAARGGNFARTMLRLAADREQLQVVADQVGAPTGADLIADITAHALRQAVARPAMGGLYHLCAAGEVNWCDYARHVLGWARAHGLPLKAGPEAVQAISSAHYPTPAARPLNSRLNTARLRAAFGLHLPHWTTGVERMLAEALNLPLAPVAR
jgi:dTDP-4-dehydrorhamnose reductase